MTALEADDGGTLPLHAGAFATDASSLRVGRDVSPRPSESVNSVLRAGILAAADSEVMQGIVTRFGMHLGASRFVAGEALDDCVPVLRGLNGRGMKANTTLLGEGVVNAGHADGATRAYEAIVARLAAEELDANIALKLTHLGLTIDAEAAYRNLERVLRAAADVGMFIRIDMEESRWVDDTLGIYRRLRAAGFDNVGTVLQSYLYRSADDLEALLPLEPNLRIVKGAYLEEPDVAMPAKRDVDENYTRLVERSLRAGAYTAVATHDTAIITHVIRFAQREGIDVAGNFEFQLLYGVRERLQASLARRGYPVLVATPFGPEWYPYLMRRLAERPANVLFFLRNVLSA